MTEFTETDDDFTPSDLSKDLSEFRVRSVRKRPVEVQAALATTENLSAIVDWIVGENHAATLGNGQLIIQTLEGPFTVRPGDQVIRGLAGEFYRHEGGELFERAYEELG